MTPFCPTTVPTASLDPKQVSAFREETPVTPAILRLRVEGFLCSPQEDYCRVNQLRNWFNAQFFPTFELYLEDVWNEYAEGETHFDYILRACVAKNETERLAYDIYTNHRDAKGVWHLGPYQKTIILISDAELFTAFMSANGHQWP